jgi:hypothetical protein
MGNIKQNLASVALADYPAKNLEIELNYGTTGGKDIVHLQTNLWRIELDDVEFQQFADSIIEAAEKLKKSKKIQ